MWGTCPCLLPRLTIDLHYIISYTYIFSSRRLLNNNFQSEPWCIRPGQNAKQEILKVITNSVTSDYYYKMDKRPLENRSNGGTYYQCTDLYIGAILNVYGRKIILYCTCDELTKNFFMKEYGFSEYMIIYRRNIVKTGILSNSHR